MIGKWIAESFNALDFISLNVCLPDYLELQESWESMSATNILNSEKTKHVWITEFGYFASNRSIDQASAFNSMLKLFASLPISGYLARQWIDSTVQDSNSQSNGNICANITNIDG